MMTYCEVVNIILSANMDLSAYTIQFIYLRILYISIHANNNPYSLSVQTVSPTINSHLQCMHSIFLDINVDNQCLS